MPNPILTEPDFERAAKSIGCSVAAVKAVAEVEAPKGGFLPSGRPTILFEAHQFSRLTKSRYDESHPQISVRTWEQGKRLYIGGEGEWKRLSQALELDPSAAIQAASWGKFQVMGFNYKVCGFVSPNSFVEAMSKSEGEQLLAFVQYVKNAGLADELVRLDWVSFALGYNGRGYWKNQYDSKLRAAFVKYSKK